MVQAPTAAAAAAAIVLQIHFLAPLLQLTTVAPAAAAAAHGRHGPGLQLANLRTEYLTNPLGLDKAAPRFTWELHGEDTLRGLAQASYRLKVGANGAADGSVWDSTVVRSARSFQVKYAGPQLASGTVYTWAVTVRTSAGMEQTSGSALFSTGLLTRAAWGADARFIGIPVGDNLDNATCPWFRKTFRLPSGRGAGGAAAAGSRDGLMYVASIGYHELFVNGHAASEAVLLPSVSYLPKRVLYRTYNISALLKAGAENVVGIWAAPGWAEYPDLVHDLVGTAPLVLARLQVGTFSLVSDASWKLHESTTRHLGIWGYPIGNPGGPVGHGFGGDAIDLSKDLPGWSTVAVDDSKWPAVAAYSIAHHDGKISADAMEPTIRHSSISAKNVSAVADGSWLVEMDELYTGWFEVANLKGEPGATIRFQVSTTAGLPVEFLMADSLTFGQSGEGSFRMRFAYHEIHYITISGGGLKVAPSTGDVVGYRLTSLGPRTGDFSCSSELISKMYDTTVNNYRGLTTGGMTVDCPHRERRGYGGDGHTSYQFALANYPVGAYFNKWTRDFADTAGQPSKWGVPAGTGWVPNTAPTVSGGGGPAWSGFVITNPWQTYNTYGDIDILKDMYPTMTALLSFYTQHTHADDGLLHPFDPSQWDFLGDWITPHGNENKVDSPENLLFNNCYLHYITELVAQISSILGDSTAAAKYYADAARIAAAVNKAFGDPQTGVYVDRLQTHAVMPLASGLVPARVANKTWRNLADQITRVDSSHLDTGLTGTYFMTKLLMESGRNDLVFAYASQTTFPSYGYFLELGYTTWPERWDVKSGDSLMHGCYNGIGLWFVEGVAGIRVHASEDPPLTIRAGVDAGDLSWARGHRAALHGRAESSWAITASGFVHNVTVPGNAVASVLIPSPSDGGVTESGVALRLAKGVTVVGAQTVNHIRYTKLSVVAGVYRFASSWRRKKSV